MVQISPLQLPYMYIYKQGLERAKDDNAAAEAMRRDRVMEMYRQSELERQMQAEARMQQTQDIENQIRIGQGIYNGYLPDPNKRSPNYPAPSPTPGVPGAGAPDSGALPTPDPYTEPTGAAGTGGDIDPSAALNPEAESDDASLSGSSDDYSTPDPAMSAPAIAPTPAPSSTVMPQAPGSIANEPSLMPAPIAPSQGLSPEGFTIQEQMAIRNAPTPRDAATARRKAEARVATQEQTKNKIAQEIAARAPVLAAAAAARTKERIENNAEFDRRVKLSEAIKLDGAMKLAKIKSDQNGGVDPVAARQLEMKALSLEQSSNLFGADNMEDLIQNPPKDFYRYDLKPQSERDENNPENDIIRTKDGKFFAATSPKVGQIQGEWKDWEKTSRNISAYKDAVVQANPNFAYKDEAAAIADGHKKGDLIMMINHSTGKPARAILH